MSSIILLNQPNNNGGSIISLGQEGYTYKLPKEPTSEKDILNYNLKKADQKWARSGIPKNWASLSEARREEFIETETRYCFEDGRWVLINGNLLWLPPDYYFTLEWWFTDAGYFKFRYNQLLEAYFEHVCEDDPLCIASFRFKKRRDGLTTRRMAKMFWKAVQTPNAWFGLQSKTGSDAKDVCWKNLLTGFRRFPKWWMPDLSGSTDPKTKIEFKKPGKRIGSQKTELFAQDQFFLISENDDDLNTTIDWRDTSDSAYDGQKLAEVSLDEFAKWEKASAYQAYLTYKKSVTLDDIKVGIIHAFTSPAQTNDRGHKDSEKMWEECNPAKKKDVLTPSKGFRWFSSALDSYAGAIDEYGYCDRDKAYKMIMSERNEAKSDELLATTRQTPMYVEEVFDSVTSSAFLTEEDIKARKKVLISMHYIDPEQTTPKYVYGNIEWTDGLEDTSVYFKPSMHQEDFSISGRWCFHKIPESSQQLNKKFSKGKYTFVPPMDSENVMGVDPFDFKRVATKSPSNGAALIGQCFDFMGTGDENTLLGAYNYRCKDPNVFFEDMIKGAVLTGSHVNTESRNPKILDYFEARGYFDFLLPKTNDPKQKDIKGTPTTGTKIDEICTLIEGFTANYLEKVFLDFVLGDVLIFNPDDTQKGHLTMALGHMLLGFAKRRKWLSKRRGNSRDAGEDLANAIREAFG